MKNWTEFKYVTITGLLLTAALFFASCSKSDYKRLIAEREPAPSELCVAQCVESMVYPLDEVDGTAIKEMRSVCEAKFKKLKCCAANNNQDYFTSCGVK